MWCPRCKQHVAALVGESGDCTICADCGTEIDALADLRATLPVRTMTSHAAGTQNASSTVASLPYLACSRARLDHIGRRLESLGRTPHFPPQAKLATIAPSSTSEVVAPLKWFASVGLFAGVTALVCGATLAGWSLIADRVELWNIGLPTAMIGQFLLLAALASQWDFRQSQTDAQH
jgi:hypothetical protein